MTSPVWKWFSSKPWVFNCRRTRVLFSFFPFWVCFFSSYVSRACDDPSRKLSVADRDMFLRESGLPKEAIAMLVIFHYCREQMSLYKWDFTIRLSIAFKDTHQMIANFETNTDETRPSDFVTLMIIIHTRLETKYVNWKHGKLSGVKRKIFLPVFQRSEEQSLAKELDIVMPNKIPRQRAPFFQNSEHRILVSPSNWLIRQTLEK